MKIFHWLFGSFFRTIGRTIALLLMGSLLYYILSINGIGISDLFFDSVKADTLATNVWTTYYHDANKTNALSGIGNLHQYFELSSNSNNISTKTLYFNANIVKQSNYDYIRIPFILAGTNLAYTYASASHCSYEYVNGYYYPRSCSYTGDDTQYIETNYEYRFSATLITDGGGLTTCSFDGDNIKCYLNPGYTYTGIQFTYNLYGQYNTTRALFGHTVGYYKDSQNTIIENQQTIIQQQNESIQNQQNTTQQMLDDNTTQAQDDAEGFFSSFSTPDVGGLSAIITAPLNTIRSLLTSTCTNLVLPLPFVNKNLTLPCMNDIYTEHFGLFFTLYQTIILAIISYRCIRSVFFDIKGFSNPDDDRIEVMDL